MLIITILILPLGDLDGGPAGLGASSGTHHLSNVKQGDDDGGQDDEDQKNHYIREADAASYMEADS